ncbi:MAG: RidA family protein [Brevinematia bacterium]
MKFIDDVGDIKPVGHYSTCVILDNGFLFLSGQISIDNNGNIIGSTIREQTQNILNNISRILGELGYSKENIFKVVVYLTDMSKFQEFNDEYKKFFGNLKPVRTTVGVKELPKSALIEIEISAFKKL